MAPVLTETVEAFSGGQNITCKVTKVTPKSGAMGKGGVPDRYVCTICGFVDYYHASEQ